jgi:hypothetical protein
MTLHIEYITDVKGKAKSVVIPTREWQAFTKEYEMLKKKLSVMVGLDSSLKEVKEIKAGKKKAKPFSEFLNEL